MTLPRALETGCVPTGFISADQAAAILGCPAEYLHNRRWVRRHGLPAMQLRRGWPMFFDEAKLREWCLKATQKVTPYSEADAPSRRKVRRRARAGTAQASR
jgi:hypothetical protein